MFHIPGTLFVNVQGDVEVVAKYRRYLQLRFSIFPPSGHNQECLFHCPKELITSISMIFLVIVFILYIIWGGKLTWKWFPCVFFIVVNCFKDHLIITKHCTDRPAVALTSGLNVCVWPVLETRGEKHNMHTNEPTCFTNCQQPNLPEMIVNWVIDWPNERLTASMDLSKEDSFPRPAAPPHSSSDELEVCFTTM